jgi:hydroxymethylbilane synthase
MPLRLATRGSTLALAQTRLAAEALLAADDTLEVETIEVTTAGDRDRTTSLRTLGGQGVFVGAVREAVLRGDADIAVHSMKDMPTATIAGLTVAAVLDRGDPRDALVSRSGKTLSELPAGARVGTSSTRRAALVHDVRPDLEVAEIRGNVDTRIAKVDAGDYDATLLAVAGLERLGHADRIAEAFPPGEFPPAPAQGVIALECRADDEATRRLLSSIDRVEVHVIADAERAVLAALGTGCDLGVGAYATVEGDRLTIIAALGGGSNEEAVRHGESSGPLANAEALGRRLAAELAPAYVRDGAP